MTDGEGYPPELIESMEALSKLVLDEQDVASTLRSIVGHAAHAVDGAEHCTLSGMDGGEIENLAATGPIGVTLDDANVKLKEIAARVIEKSSEI